MKASQRLALFTGEADKIINHLLGYLLAITGLIAFIDVVGNGKALDAAPALFWAWVIVQGLGVDFQLLALLRRLPALYTGHRKIFVINLIFLVLLFVMLITIGAVFVQSIETPSGGIAGAMATLGIPHWGFVWLRSIMSALLLVVFGVDRALEVASEQAEQLPVPANVVTQEQLRDLLASWQTDLAMTLRHTLIEEVTMEVRRLTPPAPPLPNRANRSEPPERTPGGGDRTERTAGRTHRADIPNGEIDLATAAALRPAKKKSGAERWRSRTRDRPCSRLHQ